MIDTSRSKIIKINITEVNLTFIDFFLFFILLNPHSIELEIFNLKFIFFIIFINVIVINIVNIIIFINFIIILFYFLIGN